MLVPRDFRQWLAMLLAIAVHSELAPAAVRADESAPSFDADIRPILAAKCFRCHGEEVQKGELALHVPQRILKGGESGEIIAAGKAAESRLYELVSTGEMPPDKKNPL